MKKSGSKLLISAFLTVFAIALMVTVSYAWVTLSDSPALTGIQINIGGSNTIKVAPDKITTVDGQTVHYPGYFQENFEISQYKEYSYLAAQNGLLPISTADGIRWFAPSEELTMGVSSSYQLSDYELNDTLTSENYIYIDFWVVSPLADCDLRLSIGSENEGTYLVGMPDVIEDSTQPSGYALSEEYSDAAACARIGFLVNPEDITENTAMEQYIASESYEKNYTKLRGSYQEEGAKIDTSLQYDFLIYEPNALMHNNERLAYVHSSKGLSFVSANDGDYVVTRPIGIKNNMVQLVDISDRLAVQMNSTWKQTLSGESLLNQIFQGNYLNGEAEGKSLEELAEEFFVQSMKGNYSEYVKRANFFSNTKMLYYAGNGSVTEQEDMLHLQSTTAVRDGVIVSLEKNVPQRVRMYVWLEGQDVDCVREAALDYFVVGIELAGSTQD